MPTLTANATVLLDGATDFQIESEDYEWTSGRFLESIFVWAPDTAATRLVDVSLSGSGWTTAVLRSSGNTATTLRDGATGGNRFIESILLHGNGDNRVTLTTTGANSLSTGAGDDTVVTLRGWINSIRLADGDDSLRVGSGGAETVSTGNGNDTVTAAGEVSFITTGRGEDRITTLANWVGVISAGRGEDSVRIGRGGVDYVSLGRDADIITLTRQADGDALVTIHGGGNTSTAADRDSDTVMMGSFTLGQEVDLASQRTIRSAHGSFVLREIEHVVAGSGNDTLRGDDENNRLSGRAGADVLEGREGADILIGGAGADRFVFSDVEDSTGAAGATDRIIGFSRSEGDRIDLSAIDANTALAGNQAFTFIGATAFSGVAGQLRAQRVGTQTVITADIDGDGVADLGIRLAGAQILGDWAFTL